MAGAIFLIVYNIVGVWDTIIPFADRASDATKIFMISPIEIPLLIQRYIELPDWAFAMLTTFITILFHSVFFLMIAYTIRFKYGNPTKGSNIVTYLMFIFLSLPFVLLYFFSISTNGLALLLSSRGLFYDLLYVVSIIFSIVFFLGFIVAGPIYIKQVARNQIKLNHALIVASILVVVVSAINYAYRYDMLVNQKISFESMLIEADISKI